MYIVDAEIWEACKVVHGYFQWLENREIAREKERLVLKSLLSPLIFDLPDFGINNVKSATLFFGLILQIQKDFSVGSLCMIFRSPRIAYYGHSIWIQEMFVMYIFGCEYFVTTSEYFVPKENNEHIVTKSEYFVTKEQKKSEYFVPKDVLIDKKANKLCRIIV